MSEYDFALDGHPHSAIRGDIIVRSPGQREDDTVISKIADLFDQNYHRYHFRWKLFDNNRYRFLQFSSDDTLLGFGTIELAGRFGVLSNLLVADSARGQGIGLKIERARMDVIQALGLTPYTSCVTLGTKSQVLKEMLGMTPINWKLGNRINVLEANNISSAVTYIGNLADCPVISSSLDARLEYDDANDRIRLICTTQGQYDREVSALRASRRSYVDMVAHPHVQPDPDFILQGIDIDLSRGKWGRLWQLDNGVRQAGLSGSLDLSVPIAKIATNAENLVQTLGRE